MYSSSRFDGGYSFLTYDTIIMNIPDDARITKESMYSITSKNYLDGAAKNVTSYDDTIFGHTPIVVVKDNSRSTTSWKNPFVVTGSGEKLDGLGSICYYVEGYLGEVKYDLQFGTESTYADAEGTQMINLNFESFTPDVLEAGDVVYTSNGGDIVKCFSVDTFRNNPNMTMVMLGGDGDMCITVDKIYDVGPSKTVLFGVDGITGRNTFEDCTYYDLIEVTENDAKVYPASFDDIRSGDTILYVANTYYITKCYIYRNKQS